MAEPVIILIKVKIKEENFFNDMAKLSESMNDLAEDGLDVKFSQLK